MENLIYTNPTKIIFGKQSELQVGEEIKKYGKKVLVHYGGNTVKSIGLLPNVLKSLDNSNVDYVVLGGVTPNPLLSMVRKGIELCKREGIDCVLAVGGGSVIDSAKAIACGVKSNDDIWDIISKRIMDIETIPVATVLSVPGSGSESSFAFVITNEETKEKISYRNNVVRPVFSVLNPEYTFSISPFNTACGAVDAIGHIIERYFTNSKNVTITDGMCEAVMKNMMVLLKKCLESPKDYGYRSEIMWGCKVAHDGTLGVGRIEDWACHAIEHELSARFNIAHGAGLAMIYPAWMKYIYKRDLPRFVQFARNVFDINTGTDEEIALSGISQLEEFYNAVGLNTKLSSITGMSKDLLMPMAQNVIKVMNGNIGNYVSLNAEDIYKIYELAY